MRKSLQTRDQVSVPGKSVELKSFTLAPRSTTSSKLVEPESKIPLHETVAFLLDVKVSREVFAARGLNTVLTFFHEFEALFTESNST